MTHVGVYDFEILPGSRIRVKNGDELIEATITQKVKVQALNRTEITCEDAEVFKIPKKEETDESV